MYAYVFLTVISRSSPPTTPNVTHVISYSFIPRNNKGGGTAPFPAGRFGSRPWTSARINPLQQLAAAAAGGASHMSTGISYGSAARAQATTDSQAPPPPKVPNFRQPHSQPHTQFDPSLAFPPPSQVPFPTTQLTILHVHHVFLCALFTGSLPSAASTALSAGRLHLSPSLVSGA